MDVVWFGKPLVDRSVMAIFAWGEVEVQNFMRLLQGRGGVGSRVCISYHIINFIITISFKFE